MATLLSALLKEVADHLQENINFTTGLYSQKELIGYVNDGQRDLMDAAPIKMNTATVSSVVDQKIYSEPSNSLGLIRVAYAGKRLYRSDRGQLDREDPDWRSREGVPRRFHVDHLPNLKFELDRKPQSVKTIHLVFNEAPPLLTLPTESLIAHDAFRHAIKFYVLAKACSKQGEGQDLQRGQYCFERYNALRDKAKAMTGGN